MRQRTLTLGVIVLLAGAGMLWQRPAQAQDSPDPKTVPITVTFRHGNKAGTINGTFTVQRFGVVRDTLVAIGQFSGTATGSNGKSSGVSATSRWPYRSPAPNSWRGWKPPRPRSRSPLAPGSPASGPGRPPI